MSSELHKGINRNIWPEQVYRYVEHYFWEPQHLLKTKASRKAAARRGEKNIEAFYRLIRSQEVPLNLLANVCLRIVPGSVREELLRTLWKDSYSPDASSRCRLLYGEDQPFTQPDIQMQTVQQRFFVELKVEHRASLAQVMKYLLLHGYLDRTEGHRDPYLCFVAPRPIAAQWRGKKERIEITEHGLERFVKQTLSHKLPAQKRLVAALGEKAEANFRELVQSIRITSVTWQEFGDSLLASANRRAQGELGEMMNSLTSEFLEDLKRRQLWQPPRSIG
jgi:hypothetical protein